MNRNLRLALVSAAGVIGALCVALTVSAEPPADPARAPGSKDAAAVEQTQNADERVPVEVARDRAKLMHRIYSTTLEVMHDHYFHRERSTVPARAMEDIFDVLDRQAKVQARWISVNTKAMSLDHEPETEFEKQAAKEIAAGKEEFESVEKGIYRRAGAIPLAQGCVSCHTGFFTKATKTPRFAGLVISIPVREE